MIEIKAEAKATDNEVMGVETSVEVKGYGEDIVSEAIAAIKGLMINLKGTDEKLHMMVLLIIANDPSILKGKEDEDEEEAHKSELADLMSKAIIREGELN